SVIAVAMLGGMLWWTVGITGLLDRPVAGSGSSAAVAEWQPYSDALFQQQRSAGKAVLVKFTANWCLTCQSIERNVFRDPAVWDALRKNDVVAMKVDLTDADAPGGELLRKLNPAGGIPLTAIYPPGNPDAAPIQLSSIYTT